VEGPVTLSPEYQETVRSGFLPEIIDAALNPELLPILIQKLPAPMARLLHALTRTTVSPTGITTPGSWNTLGSHAVVTLDVRSVPGTTWEQVHDLIELSLGELNAHVDIALIERGLSTASPTGTELWDIVERASQSIVPGSRLVPTMAPGITDARFMREQGAIAYGVGLYSDKLSPLDMVTMLHGDNERVDVESIALMQSLWCNIFDIYDSR
jgi:acetylornithine deacetylase/succinyl-diaminopimelate desuccinylase-like protein